MGSRVGTALACSTFFSRSRAKAEQRYGVQIKTIVIQEAGLDGFWIYRLLLAEGIESHVVDAASIAVARRHRRAKTDSIDGETLLRTLMAWARGERRVCSMVRGAEPGRRGSPAADARARRRCSRNAFSIPIGSRACSAARASGITIRFGRDRVERLEALRPNMVSASVYATCATSFSGDVARACGMKQLTPRSA